MPESKWDAFGKRDGSDAYAQRLLGDLRRVGPGKPMGNLPLDTIQNICKIDIATLESELKSRGLATLIVQRRPGLANGALHVYDPVALSELLQRNVQILENYGWPTEPPEFVRKVGMEQAPGSTPLYDLVADAFGDKDDPFRSENRRPTY